MIPLSQKEAPWWWNLAFVMINFEQILSGLLQTMCRWLEVWEEICMSAALAQLTDKMDPIYIIPNGPSGFHNDAHIKKENVGFLKNGKKLLFSAVSQHSDYIEGWFFVRVTASWSIRSKILISDMAAIRYGRWFKHENCVELDAQQ